VERYSCILEEYLSFAGNHTRELKKQHDIVQRLTRIASYISNLKRSKERSDEEISAICMAKLVEFNSYMSLLGNVQISLNPKFLASALIVDQCKFMSSKMAPLWLVFKNADPEGSDIVIIFKSGDDLRQDILTLQLLQVMDKIWLSENIDMRLTPYTCIATGWNDQGKGVGMIHVVVDSDTTSRIQLKYGGGALGALRLEPLDHYLRDHNRSEGDYLRAVENFWRSCAGYCVATYVLGIGDRHNGNIMVHHDGHLFHIDFGHFLGNFKSKFGIKRERAAFVLTPEMAYVMGGKKYKSARNFREFEEVCKEAFKVLRKHSSLFINLFILVSFLFF
jgi:phosphatidylinositol-4,5-bisphosphate 3-kinase